MKYPQTELTPEQERHNLSLDLEIRLADLHNKRIAEEDKLLIEEYNKQVALHLDEFILLYMPLRFPKYVTGWRYVL